MIDEEMLFSLSLSRKASSLNCGVDCSAPITRAASGDADAPNPGMDACGSTCLGPESEAPSGSGAP